MKGESEVAHVHIYHYPGKDDKIGKARDVSKKIGDVRRTLHEKVDMIKDRNSKSLTRHKRLRRGGNNTQKNCTKKGLNDRDNPMV